MSNMSYCRFQNTSSDLSDCAEHILDAVSREEAAARVRLVYDCINILEELHIYVALDNSTVEQRLADFAEPDEE